MNDLFNQSAANEKETLTLPGAQVWVIPQFLEATAADHYFTVLMRDIAWDEKKIFVWGKWHTQPRLVAWYGDPDATYTYSGSTLTPLSWTPALAELREHAERASAARYNSVLLNLYRDENDRMG